MANPKIQNVTSFPTVVSSTLKYHLGDGTGFVVLASCTGTPPTTADTFQVGCQMLATDTASGVVAQFVNTGTTATPIWSPLGSPLLVPNNYASDNSNGATNAPCVSLFTVGTVKAVLATGFTAYIKLSHTLQKNGTNTLNINGTTKNLVSAASLATLGTAFAVGSVIHVVFTPGVTASGCYQVLGY